ncbi:transporter [Hydrogenovibrio crunogenus]|uniref:Transporter n=1 Tax=Hydrogenovibrio crunogenus TaxID=39765 RepID=A0A4P7P0P2_9GAMM|nr:transporter [Hydrogenovibrio crunogenus]QBZ83355.1 transporter [Hydrogenovibrio crunogenus]
MRYFYGIFGVLATQSVWADALRPLATDRPDATESFQTVDKGYFQIESSIAAYSMDKTKQNRVETWSLAETNLKYGVTDNVDVQLVFSPYLVEKTSKIKSLSGQGDIQLRSKINLWGNDQTGDGLALLPYLKVPNGRFSNDEYEGGLIVTYGTDYKDYSLGAQIQMDRAYDDDTRKHEWAGSHTFVIGRGFENGLGAYIEYIGDYTVKHDYMPYASFGGTWQTSKNFQWDVGSQLALSDQGNDQLIFGGFTIRF